jgi:flagellar L-ring protein FlgH
MSISSALGALVLMWAGSAATPAADVVAVEGFSMFEESTYRSLVSGDRAARVGDVLAVIVQEAASATSTADLRRQRNFTVAAQGGTSATNNHVLSARAALGSRHGDRAQR